MSRHSNNRLRDTYLPVALLAADTVVTFAALYLAFIIRYKSPIGRLGVDVPDANLADYLPLLVLGAALLIASFAQQGLYDGRVLLRRYQNLNLILKGAAFWLVAEQRK